MELCTVKLFLTLIPISMVSLTRRETYFHIGELFVYRDNSKISIAYFSTIFEFRFFKGNSIALLAEAGSQFL